MEVTPKSTYPKVSGYKLAGEPIHGRDGHLLATLPLPKADKGLPQSRSGCVLSSSSGTHQLAIGVLGMSLGILQGSQRW